MYDIYRVISSPPAPTRGRTVGRFCCRVLWSMASGVVVVLANPPTVPRARPCPVAPVVGMVMAVESAVDGGLAPVKGHTASEGCRPCPPRVLQGRKVQGVGGTVAMRCQTGPHSTPLHTGNSGTVTGAG